MKFLREIASDMYLRRPPTWMVMTAIVLVIASWLPLVYIARMRTNPDSRPPIQLFQGMFHQPRYNAQEINPIFADNRAMREPVDGTVARGSLIDPHFALGFRVDDNFMPVTSEDDQGAQQTQYYQGYPEQVRLTPAFMQRGQQQYTIHCYPCHGTAGYGDGPINQRATQLTEQGRAVWTPASNLHAQDADGELLYGPQLYPEGKLFSIITNGIRNMPAYGSQIEPINRWAIVAYVRALQVSQTAPEPEVPADQRDALRASAWADYAGRQVTAAETTLRQMATRLASVERDAQEAPAARQATAQAELQRVASLIEQANQRLGEAREAAEAARSAAEQGRLAPARQAGERAAEFARAVSELQKQLSPPQDEQGDAGDAAMDVSTTVTDTADIEADREE